MMELSGSGKLYMQNYYVLDQARQSVHDYLDKVINHAVNEANDSFNTDDRGVIRFNRFIQKDGGYAAFSFKRDEPIPGLPSVDKWNFHISYRDVMRTNNLISPTNCRMYCYSPKSHSKQIEEIKRMSSKLNLPNPYDEVEFDLSVLSFEDAVAKISSQFIEFYENFMSVVQGLIVEAKK